MFFVKNVKILFEYVIIIKFVTNNRDDYRNIIYTLSIIANSCIDTTYMDREPEKVQLAFRVQKCKMGNLRSIHLNPEIAIHTFTRCTNPRGAPQYPTFFVF